MSTTTDDAGLDRSLGLLEALTIGIGTMVGAGIFVLPGLVLERVGPAAVASFALGGTIATLCAMAAAEVATGMPRSGGGYYFVSRALGPLWGAIVGWGSWFGLIFATAFYAVGFGEYLGPVVGISPTVLALVMTVALSVLNLVSTQAAGRAQAYIVIVLLAVLAGFVGHGTLRANPSLLAGPFAPFGLGAIWAGTATLFVSYCGFGEIASMAEEIRDPGRNLPRALLGSVIGVTVLYCIIVVLAGALRPWADAGRPTLLAELASELAGRGGRTAVLMGAVFATVSSANASIMSASRISFAMGRDRLVSDWLAAVHPKTHVPHRSVALTGALTAGVVLIGELDLLAEAAGLLHLLLYGLICIACILLRVAKPAGYTPRYEVPWFPWVPALGAVGCLAVAFFMEHTVVLSGVVLIVLSTAHFWFWGRKRTELRGGWPVALRRAVLEPGLRWVERLGAEAEPFPVAVVALANPARGAPRLALAGAIVGARRGEVVAVTVARSEGELDGEVAAAWQAEIRSRGEAVAELAGHVEATGGRVRSVVPVGPSVPLGLASAAEAFDADLVLLGWPEWDAGEAAIPLLRSADRHIPAHVLVAREQFPMPPKQVTAVVEPGASGELALRIAARLAESWGPSLRLIALAPEDADAEALERARSDLEARVGLRLRAELVAQPARDAFALAREAATDADLLLLAVPPAMDLADTVTQADSIEDTNVVVVAAEEARAMARLG